MRTTSSTGSKPLLLICGLLAVAGLGIGAMAAASRQPIDVKSSEHERRTVPTAIGGNYVTVLMAGQQVQVDGQTGQIKPLTAEEAKKLAEGLKELVNQSSEGLTPVQHPDGSVSIDLQGRYQNLAVARKNTDGTVSQSCVDNPKSAAAFFEIDPRMFGDDVRNKADVTKPRSDNRLTQPQPKLEDR